MHESPRLQKLLSQIELLHPKKIDLSLDRMLVLLAKLDNPHYKMPPTIHITGTNGKGSTHAFCLSLLTHLGYKCHAYTSPHLQRFNERIRVAGELVSDEALIETLEYILKINNGAAITFFELTTIAAFMLFAQNPADFFICEVGLGGRLDSTNVIPHKEVAIFTPIDKDHAEFLGKSFTSIATEKAGIITQVNKAVISAVQKPIVKKIIQQRANEKNIKLIVPKYSVLPNDSWQIKGLTLNEPSLAGIHQYENAALAVNAVSFLTPLKPQQINQALSNTTWQARLQNLTKTRIFHDFTPCAQSLWLDGCHNPHGAIAVANWLAKKHDKNQDLVMFVALMNNRNPNDFLKNFMQFKPKIITTSFELGHNAHDAKILGQTALDCGLEVLGMCNDYQQALQILKNYQPKGRVLIAGSLYLSGLILDYNEK